MGLQSVFQSIAETIIDAFDDVPQYFYFHSLGTSTYNATTGANVESGAIEISAVTDLSMVASTSLKSVSTDLSAYNIPTDDVQWFKISGFTSATNNGYARATAATDTGITLTQKTVETEAAGDEITITGPFYKVKGVFRHYGLEEIRDTPIQIEDLQVVIAANDLAVTPKSDDWLLWSDVKYRIMLADSDPAFATWKMWLRRL
jgi:hypothetical protein